ncbi:hypothetical protein D6D19_10142 [Aureobasidium pullulans]|uniref:F-box domain-containing protein n=2 Tax=Aureobasidium pullulans TaxID=5580 RepID=A0A074XT62_AURPU|nr:uncharacterized protein M438DRAFT_343278 [Aureobasidium pullulans EXF-150]KAG2162906.1 hypothetical protein JADG_002645 [Aureobasidium pullulans]KEQ86844.1 hypothetical protein M438DRAFT_343278 [Aureobasidium pullulans EXF-150]THV86857.1 hypothetical protein D6D29_01194 [Aureobasidium pullulans]THV89020.1 hypothetical protein D6D27_06776 [Aureobasidium pullulans]THV95208.1 hypothetical protein D6D26_07541 [Aureobasidium pullulans]
MAGSRSTRTSRTKTRRSNMSSQNSSIKTWARHQKPVAARLTKDKEQTKAIPQAVPTVSASPYYHSALIQAQLTKTHQQSRLAASPNPTKPTGSSSDSFRFLELPAEIRLMIYGYAVTESEPLYIDTLAAPPAITRVCRQTRQEALPVFLGSNSFISLFSSVPGIDATCPEPCCLTKYTTSFSPAAESWLCTLPPSQPLIRDMSFTLQPSAWDSECEISADFRMLDGKLAHGPDCPFCVNGSYGNVTPLSLSHPAVPESLKLLMSHAQQIHDAELDAVNTVLQFGKGLSLYDIVAFTKAFTGPSEVITARQCDQQRLVEHFKESLEEWDAAKGDVRYEIQEDLRRTSDDLWSEKEKWCGSM